MFYITKHILHFVSLFHGLHSRKITAKSNFLFATLCPGWWHTWHRLPNFSLNYFPWQWWFSWVFSLSISMILTTLFPTMKKNMVIAWNCPWPSTLLDIFSFWYMILDHDHNNMQMTPTWLCDLGNIMASLGFSKRTSVCFSSISIKTGQILAIKLISWIANGLL